MLQRTAVVLVLLGLGLVAAAPAQLPGTLFGQVEDENGEPIVGVKIVITNPEAPKFYQEEITDKRGRYSIFLTNTNPPYNFTFSKEGYEPIDMPGYKVIATKKTRQNLSMRTMKAVQAAVIATTDEGQEVEAKGSYIKVYNEGVALLQAGDFDNAKILFDDALQKKPDYGPAHGGLARVYWKQEQWEPALMHAQKSMDLNPEDTEISQVLYAAYSALGQKKEADEILSAIQVQDPEKAGKNLFNQAVDLYNSGQMAEALPGFERVLAADPNNGKALYMLGICYINEGSNDRAKEMLGRFLEIAPNDSDAGTAKEMLSYLE